MGRAAAVGFATVFALIGLALSGGGIADVIDPGPDILPPSDIHDPGPPDDHDPGPPDDSDRGPPDDHDPGPPVDDDDESTATPTPTDTPTPTTTTPNDTPTDTSGANIDASSSSLEVVDASVPADWVREGYETLVWVTVENTAEVTTTEALEVTVDGERIATPEVSVDAGTTTTIALEIAFQTGDGGTVAVEGVEAGEIAVGGDNGGSTPPQTVDEQPGFGPVVTVLAVFLVVLELYRRSRTY